MKVKNDLSMAAVNVYAFTHSECCALQYSTLMLFYNNSKMEAGFDFCPR